MAKKNDDRFASLPLCPFGIPHLLFILYLIIFALLGYAPYDRNVWIAENMPIVCIVAGLVLTYRRFRFSDLAYALMSVLIILHTIGAHYTFARVPFDLITQLFDFSRNHFDRVSHFSVGFYAYGSAELILRKKWITSKTVLTLFPIFFIFTVAGGYEILEWLFVMVMAPDACTAFLGVQGDPWDAQKDMLADVLGSFLAMGLFWAVNRKKILDHLSD